MLLWVSFHNAEVNVCQALTIKLSFHESKSTAYVIRVSFNSSKLLCIAFQSLENNESQEDFGLFVKSIQDAYIAHIVNATKNAINEIIFFCIILELKNKEFYLVKPSIYFSFFCKK
jgi:hypothetical protein